MWESHCELVLHVKNDGESVDHLLIHCMVARALSVMIRTLGIFGVRWVWWIYCFAGRLEEWVGKGKRLVFLYHHV